MLPSVVISLIAVAMISPAATAPMPRSAPETTGEARELGVRRRQREDDDQRHGEHAADGGERAAQAEEAVAEHQRQVDDVRPGQHLAERQHLDELLAREPALALDELALRDREHAAEALQREAVEGEEEVAGDVGPGALVEPASRRRASLMRVACLRARLAQTLSAIAAREPGDADEAERRVAVVRDQPAAARRARRLAEVDRRAC